MTQALTEQLDSPEYRLLYFREREFQQRLEDVYLGKNRAHQPPYFDEILAELIDIEALILADCASEDPAAYGFTEEELENLRHDIEMHDDFLAASVILDRSQTYAIEVFESDVFRYMMHHRLSFCVRSNPNNPHADTVLYNKPTVPVW